MRAVWAFAAALGAGICVNAAAAQTGDQSSPACVAIPNAADRFRCYEGAPKLDFASVVLRELECDSSPRAAEIIRHLIRHNAVSSLAFHMADGINYFALPRPEKIDGITAVAVFAHDETGRFPFMRSRGRSPGAVFGIVTRDATPAVDAWRLNHSPALLVDGSASSMQDATDIGCFWFSRPEPAGTALPSAGPQNAPQLKRTGEEDLFEAGLAPKRQ